MPQKGAKFHVEHKPIVSMKMFHVERCYLGYYGLDVNQRFPTSAAEIAVHRAPHNAAWAIELMF